MAHVEGRASVELAAEAAVAVSRNHETTACALVGGFAERVGISVTACERKPMIVAGGNYRLQSVVTGGIQVSVIIDELQIGKRGVEGPTGLFGGRVWDPDI